MVVLMLSVLVIIVIIGIPSFIYYLQKKDEENQELKNIIQNVHEKIISFKTSPAYVAAPGEIKNILDYIAVNTASTTALNLMNK